MSEEGLKFKVKKILTRVSIIFSGIVELFLGDLSLWFCCEIS